MAVTVEEKPHATLGPSGWDRWSNCPGSVPLTQGMPGTSSKYAREGTAAHSLLEDCLLGGFDAEDLLGREYIVEGELFVVDMDMADAVNTALGWVRDEIDPARGDILLVEQQVPIAHLTGEEGAIGSCDVMGICDGGKLLVVKDYKHGQGVQVYASTKDGKPNGQMGMYGLGALHMLSPIYDGIERVKLVVMQPRIDWHDSFELTVDELLAFGEEVTLAAGRVEVNRGYAAEELALDLNPGDKQCKFCKAKHFCPALKGQVENALALSSTAVDFDDLTLAKKASSVEVTQDISNEKLAEGMRAADLIEIYVKALRAETERRLFDGQQVPGFYIGEGKKGNRAWANPAEAEAQLKKRLKADEVYSKKVISPTEAEKKFKAKPAIWAKIAPLITQSEGKPSVCRDGDKNAPYKLVADTGDFDDLTAAAEPLTIEATAVDVTEVDPFA